jgi:beta-galactosidase
MKRYLLFSAIFFMAASATAQPEKFNTVLYGVAYYHEYMPYDRLEKDVQMMQEAGISVVRLGESTWSLSEPQEGH